MPTRHYAPLTAARIRKLKNEAEFVALKSSILRGDHLQRQKLSAALLDLMLAVRQIIEGSKLTAQEKDEIFQNLSQIPITVEQARRDQRRALAKGEGKPRNRDDGNGGDD